MFESQTYHHVRSQVIPCVYHWYETKGSACTVISFDIIDIISTCAILTKRDDILHANNEHKSGTRVTRVRLRSEMRCSDEADNETELLKRPSFTNCQ